MSGSPLLQASTRVVVAVLLVLVGFQGVGRAQPGQQSTPAGVVPPPYAYAPAQRSADEQKLLDEGEISENKHIAGAITSLFVGFGIGQAVEGRWGHTGWIFTIGDIGSYSALIVGIGRSFRTCISSSISCNNNEGKSLLVAGVVGVIGFRIWEIVDAFAGPPRHNAKVRQLRMRLGVPQPTYATRVLPYVAPASSRDRGGTAGLTFQF